MASLRGPSVTLDPDLRRTLVLRYGSVAQSVHASTNTRESCPSVPKVSGTPVNGGRSPAIIRAQRLGIGLPGDPLVPPQTGYASSILVTRSDVRLLAARMPFDICARG